MRRRAFLRTGVAATAAAAVPVLSRPFPVHALERAFAGPPSLDEELRLASNENALGPSEAARRAILDGLPEANRYTHVVAADLRRRLAEHHGAPEASIVLGNGSTEVLQMAVQSVASPGGRLVVADPTFEHVEQYGAPWGIERVKVPLTPGWSHDLGRMREAAAGASGPALVYVCNPNNPTGSLTPSRGVEAWIEEDEETLFLVDEAYVEYVDHPEYRSALPLALSRPNVVVVRTFSKIYGLAGLRLGYAVAHPDRARRVATFSASSNLNQMGLRAAAASVGDRSHVERSLTANEEARRITNQVLDELDLERLPSHTNFVMHRIPGDLGAYIRRMRERGVRVGRPFPPLTGYNRLSFGLPWEMERFAGILRDFRREGWV